MQTQDAFLIFPVHTMKEIIEQSPLLIMQEGFAL
jgi:hypothetical protein